MIRRNTLVLFVLFVLLLAGTLFWQRTRGANAPESTPTAAAEKKFVIDNQQTQITGIRMDGPEGKRVELVRGEDGKWVLTIPEAEATDDAAVISAVTQLLSLTILSVPSQVTDLAPVGLDAPSYHLILDMEGGSQFVLNVGKETPTGNGYYILTNDRVVYIVPKTNLDSFLKLLDTPPILMTPTPEATAIPLESPTPEATVETQPATSTP